jgi:hypothetical protein
MGLQAGGMLAQNAQAGASQAAQYQYGAGVNAAGARREGWDQLAGAAGSIYEGWQNGRQPAGKSGGTSVLKSAAPLAINAITNFLKRGV